MPPGLICFFIYLAGELTMFKSIDAAGDLKILFEGDLDNSDLVKEV